MTKYRNSKTPPTGQLPNLCLDILKQPHTLIAGATGSGKSVLINNIMYTALFSTPSQKQFILIDPKLTELSQYKYLPHTIAYADSPEAAIKLLNNALNIINARNIRAQRQRRKQCDDPDLYIVIDELGDLIFTDKRATNLLGRIAMIGRSAKVHLVAATQCPNRKTLSPEFAANCTAKVGLRCDNKVESRQIINSPIATELPQYGYCYYKNPQIREPELVSIPYIPENVINEIIYYWS